MKTPIMITLKLNIVIVRGSIIMPPSGEVGSFNASAASEHW